MVINNTFPPNASKVPTSALFEQDFKASRRTVIRVTVYSFMLKTLQTWKWFSNGDLIENKKQ